MSLTDATKMVIYYGLGVLFYVLSGFTSLIVHEVYNSKYDKDIGILPLIFTFEFLTFKYKRIYYSEFGYFWCRLYKEKVYVYDQHYFLLEKLFFVYYNDDFDALSAEIKSELNYKLKESDRGKNKNKAFKSWNGYLDKKSQREGKIDEII